MLKYPFNRYGWNDLKWWFKYRLFKKYRYHKVYLNLKPGYYEYQDIIEKCIASKRFFWLFEYQYNEYIKYSLEQDPAEPIYTKEYDHVIKELKFAYLWFKKYKSRFEKKTQTQENKLEELWPASTGIIKEPTGKDREIFDRYTKLTTFTYSTTTHYLGIIVKHRMFLDT